MALTNTEQGKAYEYACLTALHSQLTAQVTGIVETVDSDAFRTARAAFNKATLEGKSSDLTNAAHAAARVILRLEPQLLYGNGKLFLSIQPDSQGIAGDVRDVVCIRHSSGWEIGISCKHNHHAVKHSRLSATIDFGKDWFGIPCSRAYFLSVVPLFNELRDMRDLALARGDAAPLWQNIPDKSNRYYRPILNAFLTELRRLSDENPEIPARLIQYMLGRYDFYKVITDDKRHTTRVEAININGTLNRPANGHRSIVDVERLRLPTRFFHMGFAPNKDNTIEIICDEGWALSMRIHNASSKVEPSLKFDVQLLSFPPRMHTQVEPW